MNKDELENAIREADVEIKKQQAEQIKAQTRKTNAEAALIEKEVSK